jgi:hypothetical protein
MGIISGWVTFSNGQPHSGVRVSVSLSGLAGGVTPDVRTDSQGRFTVRWTSNASTCDKVFVNGGVVDHNVQSGSSNLHYTSN